MKLVPPFRGELGILLRFHACAVRALDRPVLVAHEPGLECLYPDAQRVLVERRPDASRRWTYRHDQEYVEQWQRRFIGQGELVMPDKDNRLPIQPFLPDPWLEQRSHRPVDVVVCPRRREYGAEKNWDSWPVVTSQLVASGLHVFAAGLEESSYPVAAQERAWDYRRPLDATVEAMRSARLVVATASGLSLLALLCGAPLLLVAAHGGRVAPGPSRDLNGTVHHARYWPVPLEEYYQPLRHTDAPLGVLQDGWHHAGLVVQEAQAMVGEVAA